MRNGLEIVLIEFINDQVIELVQLQKIENSNYVSPIYVLLLQWIFIASTGKWNFLRRGGVCKAIKVALQFFI